MCVSRWKRVRPKTGNPRYSKEVLKQGSEGNSEKGEDLGWNLVWLLFISGTWEKPSRARNKGRGGHDLSTNIFTSFWRGVNSWGPPWGSPDSEGNSSATTSHHHRPLPEGLWVFPRRLLFMYRSCQEQTGDLLGRPVWNWDLPCDKYTHHNT